MIFNYRHPHIPAGEEGKYILRAFDRDFEVNGPSTTRIVRTTLAGWRRHKNHPDERIRRRYAWEARDLGTTFTALVAGAALYFRKTPPMYRKLRELLKELYREFGLKARFAGVFGGRWVLRKIRQEERRLAEDWTYEPPTFYERNRAVVEQTAAQPCRYTTPHTAAITSSRV